MTPGARGSLPKMAKKPSNFQWVGFDAEQLGQLDFIDFLGNNGWSRNGQTDAIMTGVLSDCAAIGLNISQIKQAMQAIGYGPHALHQLDRWESKRTTGKFGR
jgi:hypothetical protein